MSMKTQMDKLVGYQSGSIVSIDPSQRRGQVTPLPQVISTGPPLSPDAEKEERPPTEEGSMTIQPVFPTVGSPEYERYLQAIQNLPEGGLESLPRISAEPDTPTTELSPGGPDTSFVGGRDPSLVVLGLINKDSTPADVMGYLGYVNSESNQAPITLNDVVTTATNAVDFGDTTAGKILGKVTEGKSGLLSFLIGSLFGEKGPSGDATTEQALAIVERAQAESTSALQAQQEARSYADWSGDVGLAGTPSPQVSAPSAPSGIGQPSVDVGASGPGGTVGTPSGVLALSTGAASPQRSGGLVQNMYDGGVVRMADGGDTREEALKLRQKVEQIEIPEEGTPTGTSIRNVLNELSKGFTRRFPPVFIAKHIVEQVPPEAVDYLKNTPAHELFGLEQSGQEYLGDFWNEVIDYLDEPEEDLRQRIDYAYNLEKIEQVPQEKLPVIPKSDYIKEFGKPSSLIDKDTIPDLLKKHPNILLDSDGSPVILFRGTGLRDSNGFVTKDVGRGRPKLGFYFIDSEGNQVEDSQITSDFKSDKGRDVTGVEYYTKPLYLSDNPDMSSTFAGMTSMYSKTKDFERGVVTPFFIKANKVIEFPVDESGFRYSEFDKAAANLKPGEVLVAKNVRDKGSSVSDETLSKMDPLSKWNYGSNIYAIRHEGQLINAIVEKKKGGVVGIKNGGSTIIVKDNGNKIEFSPPSWFKRASDPSTPTIKIGSKDATVQTTSFYDPDLGGEILVPTIRMDEQGNLYIPDDPVKEAREREDYILIPGEDGKGTRDFATLVSKELSTMINEARRIQEPKPMYDGGVV